MSRTITRAGAKLDVGLSRSNNEDNLGYRQAQNEDEARDLGDLFVLADGMGGHAAGEVASKLAVDMIMATYFDAAPAEVAHRLVAAIEAANRLVYDQATGNQSLTGMGTTCVCGVVHGDELHIAHVGDSRAYLFRRGALTRLTSDHTWVEKQVRRGLLTLEEARGHRMRNVITRALGSAPEVEVDLSVRMIQAGDILLICSDGLTTAVEDEAIRAVLAAQAEPQAAVDALVDLANGAGGPDNIGIIAVRMEKVVPLAGKDGRVQTRRPRTGWARFLPFS